MTEPSYITMTITAYLVGDSHQVEVATLNPHSDALVAPVRGRAEFRLDTLRSLQATPLEYGQELTRNLFGAVSGEVRVRFLQVLAAAQQSEAMLRLSICIDPSARELQALRWELLRHPETDAALCTSESVLLSRFMVSRDFRPLRVRARADLSALVVVAAPVGPTMDRMRLAPVDADGELGRARSALAGLKTVRTLGGPAQPVTLERLVAELRRGIDVLYLVCHGMFSLNQAKSALILQDEQGDALRVDGDMLAAPIGDLQTIPRLVVLASCQSGGDGGQVSAQQSPAVQATLAARLADQGVPAVIAMQGFISMATVETMMPVLFTELLRDGQIDRALAAARGSVRDRDDAWMPALSTRLSNGRIWYTPGFRGGGDQDEVWRNLVHSVSAGRVVPILGPRLLEKFYGVDTARRLAESSGFPFAVSHWDDLPRVNQYVAVRGKRFNMIKAYRQQLASDLLALHAHWLPQEVLQAKGELPLGQLLRLVAQRQRDQADYVFGLLARLPAPVYLTTAFDVLLEDELRAAGKQPTTLFTRWRHNRKPAEADVAVMPPSKAQPLVYHAFGIGGEHTEASMVLTEDNYFDYLIDSAAYRLMPDEVAAPLCSGSILLLGFRLTDWHFRVLFRLLMALEGRAGRSDFCHVAVQLDPEAQTMADVERGKKYLADYFQDADKIQIFWGSPEEFLLALHGALDRRNAEAAW